MKDDWDRDEVGTAKDKGVDFDIDGRSFTGIS